MPLISQAGEMRYQEKPKASLNTIKPTLTMTKGPGQTALAAGQGADLMLPASHSKPCNKLFFTTSNLLRTTTQSTYNESPASPIRKVWQSVGVTADVPAHGIHSRHVQLIANSISDSSDSL